jgi:hypothetical protein
MAKSKPKKKSTRVPAKDKVQPPIPGAEQSDKNPRIHNAAIQYAEYRDARMEAGKEEKKADLNRDSSVKVKIKSDVPDATAK